MKFKFLHRKGRGEEAGAALQIEMNIQFVKKQYTLMATEGRRFRADGSEVQNCCRTKIDFHRDYFRAINTRRRLQYIQ